ncbi:MAG: hypothetical protein ABL923_00500 [Burkholderiaceae bacterium]
MQQQSKFYRSFLRYDFVFWSIVIIGIVFIASSHPMMKSRFDIWQHVGNIDMLVLNPDAKIVRSNWHATWAFLFRVLGINDIFTYAVIIHRVQFILNCIIIYSAAFLLFAALLPTIELDNNKSNRKQWLSGLAISSLFVWLTAMGTVSTFQQAWIMWYSVNYQITLPLLFLALSLFVNAFSLRQNNTLSVIKLMSSLLLLALVYFYHAGELAYLVFYLPILLICFTTKKNYKKTLILIVMVLIVVLIATKFYSDIVPELIKLLKEGNWIEIKKRINTHGLYNIQGGNRYLANWNELYTLSVFMAVPVIFFGWTQRHHVNQRVLLFIILSLVFCFIPTFKYSAGVASLISYAGIVNRYYFASFIFVLVPLCLYLVLHYLKILQHPVVLIASVLILMGLVLSYSKLLNNDGVFYQNVKSIKNSLYQDRVGVEFSKFEIDSIGVQINAAHAQYRSDQFIFCANYDTAHIIYYVYRQKNIQFVRNPFYVTIDKCKYFADSNGLLAKTIN